ncbi:MAG: transposase [Candidatus Obscuribacter sp.]|nr:transposase [Candidatus Obscuribacter sp.]
MGVSKEVESEILRLFYAEKWKRGTIARQLQIHHGVVDRVLTRNGISVERVRIRRSLIDPYLPYIRSVLQKYPRLTGSRLYAMVKERGYPGGIDHFRDMLARHRPKPAAEAYLRLSTIKGEEAQVDWACFGKVKIGNAERQLYAFVIVLSWSRQVFLKFYTGMSTANFLQGHVDAFCSWGGVPRQVKYDNLKSGRFGEEWRCYPIQSSAAGLCSVLPICPEASSYRQGQSKGAGREGDTVHQAFVLCCAEVGWTGGPEQSGDSLVPRSSRHQTVFRGPNNDCSRGI